ncbi:MAG: ABC transporter permease [Methanobacterium sp.]|nr:ABC transporter permease [Methanobacterium sp.]
MSFLSLIVKNPFRNRTRAVLAILGISIGIATIVALGMITDGLTSSTQTTLSNGTAEITVTAKGSNAFSATGGTLSESYATSLLNITGVNGTAGILRGITPAAGTVNGLEVNGINSSQTNLEGISITNGTNFVDGTNQVILGKSIAPILNKSVGSTISLFGKEFTVVGIYDSGNIVTDSLAFTSLTTLQNLTNAQGKLTIVAVKIDSNANATQIANAITNAYPTELDTTTATQQANLMDKSMSGINTASAAISVLAIVIGGIGIINVMIMSVFERTREIGVLKAVGWKSSDILIMILGESIILTLVAAVVGILLGYIGSEGLLAFFSSTGSVIKPVFSLDIVIRAFVIALVVGIIGGIYPAYRASRLPPTEALRYE